MKFMLLMNPDPSATSYSSYRTSPPSRPTSAATSRHSTIMLAANPNAQLTEDAVRNFVIEVCPCLPRNVSQQEVNGYQSIRGLSIVTDLGLLRSMKRG